MGRTEKDYQTLIIETMDNIRDISSKHDTLNDIEAHNKVVNAVDFLETILLPYDNPLKPYNPTITGDDKQDIHNKLRELIRIAKGAGVITSAKEKQDEEDEEFSIDDTDEIIEAG